MSAPQLTTQMASVPPLPLLLADRDAPVIASEVVIEVDEFDIWSSSHSALPKFRKPVSSSRLAKKPSKRGESGDRSTVMVSSLPVNIPDWSKILREDYRDKNRKERAANSSDAKTMSIRFAGRAVFIAIWVATGNGLLGTWHQCGAAGAPPFLFVIPYIVFVHVWPMMLRPYVIFFSYFSSTFDAKNLIFKTLN